jgi:aminopeptidase N
MKILRLPLVLALLLVPSLSTLDAQSIFDVRFDEGRSHPYDVLHTAIDVRFDEPRREVIGAVSHRIRSITDGLSMIRFDADSAMRIASVTADGRACRYRLGAEALEIDLPHTVGYDDTVTVAISYRVAPTAGMYILVPDSSNPSRRHQIWTQGEAEDHHHWLPLYDFPNDRATSEMRITVRDAWKALSNGILVDTRPNGDGTTTWHYRLDRAHAGYLIMMAAGDYLVTRDTAAGVPLSYWSYPEFADRVAPTFSQTPDVMRFLVDRIGMPYPWPSYAQIMISEFIYGGMENTTASTLNDNSLVDAMARVDYDPANLIAHEAAHQWFGDLVTTRDWAGLWLQESFATYLASLYTGHRYGDAALLNDMWEGGVSALRLDSVSGRDPIAGGKGKIANLYQRGARVLYMLERLLGEAPFWRGVRLFLARHGDGNAETADLKNALEDASGVELDWYFDQWIYGGGTPHLVVSHEQRGDSVFIAMRQTQTRDSLTGLFRLRLPIAIYHERGIARDTVWLSDEADTFALAVGSRARFVIVDEGQTWLKRLTHRRTPAELTAQLGAEHMLDRWEAAVAITRVDSADRRDLWRIPALTEAYRREPTAEVRDAIINGMGTLEGGDLTTLIAEALADSSIHVRRAAIDLTFRIPDAARRSELLRARLADSSTRIVAAALETLAATDTVGLVATLMRFKGVQGRGGVMTQAWVSAVASARLDIFVDDVAGYTRPPHSRSTRWQAFMSLVALERTTPIVRAAIVRGLSDASRVVREAAADAARAHLDGDLRATLVAMRNDAPEDRRGVIESILKSN